MATFYVRSTDGNDADDGSTWALAKATLAGAAAAAAAGDTIYVSQAHAETQASAMTITFAGTYASPTIVLCGNDAAEPPTALATSATVSTTGGSNLSIAGTAYVYGVQFQAGSGASTASILTATAAGNRQVFDACAFKLTTTSASARLQSVTAGASGYAKLTNCTLNFGSTSQFILGPSRGCDLYIENCTLAGSAITKLLETLTAYGRVRVSGCDLSNAASTLTLVGPAVAVDAIFRNCKLPASWSGSLLGAGTVLSPTRCEMHNCDSADTNYRSILQDANGTLTSETTLIRTGGASDNTTGLAWKIVTTSQAKFVDPFVTYEIPAWINSTGSKTVTVEILRDSATNLTDAEVWLEVMYLGTSGYPLGTWARDRAADILAAPADQTDSSETWTTTGMSNPNTQKLSVTVTVNEIGYVHARVCVAKASTTVYCCPKLTIA